MESKETQIQVQQNGDVTVLEIEGDVTSASENKFESAYHDIPRSDGRKILLKFEDVSYLNSGGIAVVIQFLAKAEGNGQKVGITGLSDHFRTMFKLVGITKFAAIYSSESEALEALSA